MSECHRQLSKYLAQQYDYCSTTLLLHNKKKLVLNEKDVLATLNIPCGNTPVVEAKGDKDTPEYEQLLKTWRESWNLKVGSPITQQMGEELLKRGDFEDEFKRDFVVFVVFSMIKGHQNRKANYEILLLSLMSIKSRI